MGLFLFVFTVMAVVTAMVIRVRDLEERPVGPGDPSPTAQDDSAKDDGRRKKRV